MLVLLKTHHCPRSNKNGEYSYKFQGIMSTFRFGTYHCQCDIQEPLVSSWVTRVKYRPLSRFLTTRYTVNPADCLCSFNSLTIAFEINWYILSLLPTSKDIFENRLLWKGAKYKIYSKRGFANITFEINVICLRSLSLWCIPKGKWTQTWKRILWKYRSYIKKIYTYLPILNDW